MLMRALTLVAAAAFVAVLAAAVSAQQTTQVHPGKGGSPHVKTQWTVDDAAIAITYGRPSLKGRPMTTLAPYGKEWRTGADEATTLETDKALTFGTLQVPAGTYTLFTVPGESEWQLVVSKKTGEWGVPYPAGEDLGRVPMKVEQLGAPVERLTISVDDTPTGGTLGVSWGTTKASVAFTVAK